MTITREECRELAEKTWESLVITNRSGREIVSSVADALYCAFTTPSAVQSAPNRDEKAARWERIRTAAVAFGAVPNGTWGFLLNENGAFERAESFESEYQRRVAAEGQ